MLQIINKQLLPAFYIYSTTCLSLNTVHCYIQYPQTINNIITALTKQNTWKKIKFSSKFADSLSLKCSRSLKCIIRVHVQVTRRNAKHLLMPQHVDLSQLENDLGWLKITVLLFCHQNTGNRILTYFMNERFWWQA